MIFVNVIPEAVHSLIKLLADDTKLLKTVANENNKDVLQRHLFGLCRWSENRLISFNVSKCKYMHS